MKNPGWSAHSELSSLPALRYNRSMIPEPRDAATVLVVRDCDEDLEVYMVRRSSRMGFLGGAHVFPGGAVDESDRRFPAGPMEPSSSLSGRMGIDADRARAFLVAAVRELFEEAGVLLARGEDGYVQLSDADPAGAAMLEVREGVASGDIDFAESLGKANLVADLHSPEYCGHWITPTVEKKRFDTRFFVTVAPCAQTARHDRTENSEGGWVRPADALASYRGRQIELVPPTIVMLEWLAELCSPAEVLESARAMNVECVFPKICTDSEGISILYPGDEDYESGSVRPAEPGRRLSRLCLVDGLWERP